MYGHADLGRVAAAVVGGSGYDFPFGDDPGSCISLTM